MKTTKFKHGDRVTCEIEGREVKDARISINKNGDPFICQNIVSGSCADDMFGYKCSYILKQDFTNVYVTNLKLAEKTWDNLEEGDIIKDEDGERMILGVCGRVIFVSSSYDLDIASVCYTKEELIAKAYKIKQPEPPKKKKIIISMQDVADKFGIDVKNLRIKK